MVTCAFLHKLIATRVRICFKLRKVYTAARAYFWVTPINMTYFVLCSSGKLLRDVYSQIYFDVSPGVHCQAKRQNKFENIHLSVIYRKNTKQRKFSLASLAYHAR